MAVAKAMGKTTFQGTLHKFCAGSVRSPSRETAERIATHYKLPIDALYNEKLATEEAHRLLSDLPPEVAAATAQLAPRPEAAAPAWPFERINPTMWAGLTERQRGAIEAAAVKAWRELQSDLGAIAAPAVQVSVRRANG